MKPRQRARHEAAVRIEIDHRHRRVAQLVAAGERRRLARLRADDAPDDVPAGGEVVHQPRDASGCPGTVLSVRDHDDPQREVARVRQNGPQGDLQSHPLAARGDHDAEVRTRPLRFGHPGRVPDDSVATASVAAVSAAPGQCPGQSR